ncbi:MAG: hypothetical protein ACRD0U_21480 [Acidimicrobiales bacterium]
MREPVADALAAAYEHNIDIMSNAANARGDNVESGLRLDEKGVNAVLETALEHDDPARADDPAGRVTAATQIETARLIRAGTAFPIDNGARAANAERVGALVGTFGDAFADVVLDRAGDAEAAEQARNAILGTAAEVIGVVHPAVEAGAGIGSGAVQILLDQDHIGPALQSLEDYARNQQGDLDHLVFNAYFENAVSAAGRDPAAAAFVAQVQAYEDAINQANRGAPIRIVVDGPGGPAIIDPATIADPELRADTQVRIGELIFGSDPDHRGPFEAMLDTRNQISIAYDRALR